jgi:hypothetical protein
VESKSSQKWSMERTPALDKHTVLDKHVKETLPTNPFGLSVAETSDSKAASVIKVIEIVTERWGKLHLARQRYVFITRPYLSIVA